MQQDTGKELRHSTMKRPEGRRPLRWGAPEVRREDMAERQRRGLGQDVDSKSTARRNASSRPRHDERVLWPWRTRLTMQGTRSIVETLDEACSKGAWMCERRRSSERRSREGERRRSDAAQGWVQVYTALREVAFLPSSEEKNAACVVALAVSTAAWTGVTNSSRSLYPQRHVGSAPLAELASLVSGRFASVQSRCGGTKGEESWQEAGGRQHVEVDPPGGQEHHFAR